MTRIAYTISEAADSTGVSERTIERAINAGALKAKKTSRNTDGDPVGKRLVSARALADWFDSLPDA